MLRIKSFEMKDGEGVDTLLQKYRLAEGASVFVSNGWVMVPYEDGLSANVDQLEIGMKEERNKKDISRQTIHHAQKVVAHKIQGVLTQINKNKEALKGIETDVKKEGKDSKEVYDHKKFLKDEIKRLEGVIVSFERLMINNQAEMTGLSEEIKIYDEEIKNINTPTNAKSENKEEN